MCAHDEECTHYSPPETRRNEAPRSPEATVEAMNEGDIGVSLVVMAACKLCKKHFNRASLPPGQGFRGQSFLCSTECSDTFYLERGEVG